MEETAQELTDHVSQFQKYLDEHTPELISFGIKVVLSIVVLYIGSCLIRWVLGLVRRSLGRTGMDKGAVQFLCSFLKALLYILLIFGIGMNFRSRPFRYCRRYHRSCITRWTVQPGRRGDASDLQALPGRRLHYCR